MIKTYLKIIILCLAFFPLSANYDLTIIGPLLAADGIGQIGINLVKCLNKKLNINFIPSRSFGENSLLGVAPEIQSILLNSDHQAGKVSLFIDAVWYNQTPDIYQATPESDIKIALSMLETIPVPNEWVNILNNHFDGVVVPDQWLVNNYRSSGVTKPIFVIPCPINLEDIDYTKKIKKNKPFVFGSSGSLCERKNQELLIKAFAEQFGNNPEIQLKIHTRCACPTIKQNILNFIVENKLQNIQLIDKIYSRKDYITFLKEIDCYVLISKGEGFSISPREAMYIGIPCILSNNTAHQTICNSGFALPIASNIIEAADYGLYFGPDYKGHNFNCELKDIKNTLNEMYSNYEYYLQKTSSSQKWAKQYNYTELSNIYCNLIKPKHIKLGNANIVNEAEIITDSKELYNKYINLN